MLRGILAAVAAFVVCAPVSAADYSYTFDLAPRANGSGLIEAAYALPTALQLSKGDTVTLTLNFPAPDFLFKFSPVFFGTRLAGRSRDIQFVKVTSFSGDLLNPSALTIPPTSFAGGSGIITEGNSVGLNGAFGTGGFFYVGAAHLPDFTAPFTAAGLRATFTIGDITDSLGDQISQSPIYTTAYFNFNSTAPEPGTWALMIMGFGMVGCATRRRQSRLAAVPE